MRRPARALPMPRSDTVLPQARLAQAGPVLAAAYQRALHFIEGGAAVQAGGNAQGVSQATEALERLKAAGRNHGACVRGAS